MIYLILGFVFVVLLFAVFIHAMTITGLNDIDNTPTFED